MNVSVCITILNEEKTIADLLHSLLTGTKKPLEIVIVDAGSTDQTTEIIRHYQKKDNRIKLMIEKGISRSKGRNLSIELAESETIAMTDAGCIVEPTWLERILEPFDKKEIDIVAGFYRMKYHNPMQKAFSVFLGTLANHFNQEFLPSTRSIAFRKEAWERVGGFPESLEDTAEDTKFTYNAVVQGLRIARVKSARVEWGIPNSFKEGINKIYKYALGDARSGIWLHPVKGLSSHNIKATLVLLRYLIGAFFLIYAFFINSLFYIPLVLFLIYAVWAFRKVYIEYRDVYAAFWGIIIQFGSDLAVISGLISGILNLKNIK